MSSCHCHMSATSPFLWNSWRWSAYLGRGQSHVSLQQAPRGSGSQAGAAPIPRGHSRRMSTVLCSSRGQQGTGVTARV